MPFVSQSAVIVAPVVPLIALGGAVVMTLPYGLLMGMMPPESHGAATGLHGFSRGLGVVFGPLLTGLAIDLLGSWLEDTRGYAAMFLVAARPRCRASPSCVRQSRRVRCDGRATTRERTALCERGDGDLRSRRAVRTRPPMATSSDSSTTFPVVDAGALSWLTVDQMREVDRVAVHMGLDLPRMMENAGANLAAFARELLGGDVTGRRVAVLAGPGGNGGGGLVAARRLLAAGAHVETRLAQPPDAMAPVPREQHDILERIGAPLHVGPAALQEPELTIDALLGYGQRGNSCGLVAELLDHTRRWRVISLDVPTGLELDAERSRPRRPPPRRRSPSPCRSAGCAPPAPPPRAGRCTWPTSRSRPPSTSASRSATDLRSGGGRSCA